MNDWVKDMAAIAELEAAIADDGDKAGTKVDWTHPALHLPTPKATLNMRVDKDVLDFFKSTGRGYQTRINAVLQAFKEAHSAPRGD